MSTTIHSSTCEGRTVIRELDATNLIDLEEVVKSLEPVILRGLVSRWPVVEQAAGGFETTARYLSEHYSGRPLTAYVGKHEINGRFFYNEDFTDFNFKSGHATLAQVLAKLSSCRSEHEPPTVYVGSTMIDEWFPRFSSENPTPIERSPLLASIWIGNQSRVSAHFDFPDNIACVAAGRRRFTLFPPEQLENLYVGPLDLTPSGQEISLVDVVDPDYERFPKYREAERAAVVAELAADDALFIPSMWWHHVEAQDDLNVLVNYWWCDTPDYLGTPSLALKHAMLTIRDLPKHQREHWKHQFDHYVFGDQAGLFEHLPESGRGILNPFDEQHANNLKRTIAERLSASVTTELNKVKK